MIPALIVLFEMFWLQLSLSQSNGMIFLRSIRTLVMFVISFTSTVQLFELRKLRIVNQGRGEGGPGVPVTPPPLCKPFFKQTTYNIPWRKRHDDNV